MNDIFAVANWACKELGDLGLRHCLIGGLALQAWGEPRVTRDVDLSVLVGFGEEHERIGAILARIPARIDQALEFALENRVLLCKSPDGVGIDIGLAAFPFEEAAMERSVLVEYVPPEALPTVGAEDLITMKAFAGRPQDWIDIRGIIVRQGEKLDWSIVSETLPDLLDLIGESDRWIRLSEMRRDLVGEAAEGQS